MSNIKDFFGGGGVATGTLVSIYPDGVDYLPVDGEYFKKEDFPDLAEYCTKMQLGRGLYQEAHGFDPANDFESCCELDSGRILVATSSKNNEVDKALWLSDDGLLFYYVDVYREMDGISTNGVDAITFRDENEITSITNNGTTVSAAINLTGLASYVQCMAWSSAGCLFASEQVIAKQDTYGDFSSFTYLTPTLDSDIQSIGRDGDKILLRTSSSTMYYSSDGGATFDSVGNATSVGYFPEFGLVRINEGIMESTLDGYHYTYVMKAPYPYIGHSQNNFMVLQSVYTSLISASTAQKFAVYNGSGFTFHTYSNIVYPLKNVNLRVGSDQIYTTNRAPNGDLDTHFSTYVNAGMNTIDPDIDFDVTNPFSIKT